MWIYISLSCLSLSILLSRQMNVIQLFFLLIRLMIFCTKGPSCPWSYGTWMYNYLCSQCLSPLMLWVPISIRARCITLCDNVCQWLATGRWFSPGTPVSFTNKTERHDMAEILLKVALNTIKQTTQTYSALNIKGNNT
jgi:hypothetical protein